MTSLIYTHFKTMLLGDHATNLAAAGNLCKCALYSALTPTAADTTYGALTGETEVSESGTNYTAGGYSMTAANNSILTAGAPVIGWTNTTNSSTAVWAAATFTAAYAAIYNTTVSNYAMVCLDFGGNKSVTAGTFTINWNASGIITFT